LITSSSRCGKFIVLLMSSGATFAANAAGISTDGNPVSSPVDQTAANRTDTVQTGGTAPGGTIRAGTIQAGATQASAAQPSATQTAQGHANTGEASTAPGAAAADPSAAPGTTGDSPSSSSAADAGAGDTGLAEVTVSGSRLGSQKQLETQHDVPQAVSIISGADLASLDQVSITDILRRLANIQFDFGNPRTGGIALRGVNASTQAGDNIDPSVLVNVDGVSYVYAPLANGSDYFDIDSVSATRGPQGTQGGYNSSLGTLEITTRKPSFTDEADGSLTYGKNNSLLAEAAWGGPIVDDWLAYRVAFERNYQDGEYENSFAELFGRSSYVNTDRTQGRVELLATPSSDFYALLIADYQPKGNEYLNGLTFHLPTPDFYADGQPVNQANQPVGKLSRSWFASEGSYTFADYLADPVDDDNNGAITTGTGGVGLTLDWKLPVGDLKAISAYRYHYFSAANDEGTPFDITDDGGYIVNYHQFTQEIRLNSNPGGPLDWVTGLYYLDNYDDNISRTRYGSDAGAWDASAVQYAILDANVDGQLLMEDSQDRVYRGTEQLDTTEAAAWFGHATWHITDPLALALGLRVTHQDRTIVQSGDLLDQGYGAALDPVAITDVDLGGFNSNPVTGALLPGNTAAQLALANGVAQQYFGVPTYAGLTSAALAEVATAKSLRASALGALYPPSTGLPYETWLPDGDVSLSYKINDEVMPYFTYQRGVKSGATQINSVTNIGGQSYLLEPETSNSFELGVNNKLLQDTLILNADVYLDNVYNFQQSVYFYDAVATQLANTGVPVYVSGNGNVPWVQLKGVELEGIYSAIPDTVLRISGAYNDAIYKDYPFAAQPAEDGNITNPPYTNLSGKTLPNAPKIRLDADAGFRVPFGNNKEFHADIDYYYQSRFNSDPSLSEYAWVGEYGLVNASAGLSLRNGKFDVSLVAKNLLNKDYIESRTWNSWTPGFPSWYGIRIASRFD
jgi:iron complex outermembrane recepter protein